jgi:lipoyl(octanoyl) transferase
VTSSDNSDNTILNNNEAVVRQLGLRDYQTVWREMQHFTDTRNADTADEIWLLEHPPVFTLGLNGKPEHILDPGDIPIVKCDRGGQVTYHGPGQLIAYLLLDLRRHELGVKALVSKLEQAVIDLLAEHQIPGQRREGAPGIYVNDAKIAALGLRIRKGCSYHGLSLNVDMNLEPFSRINPCGFEGLATDQLRHHTSSLDMPDIKDRLISHLTRHLAI